MEVVPGSGDLPLAQVVRDLPALSASYPELQPTTQLVVAAGQVDRLALEVRREAMSAAVQDRLLKITTSHGLRYWIPVSARRADLSAQP